MVLGIAGSRQRNTPEDKELLRKRIIELKPNLIVTGGIKSAGPEKFVVEIAEKLGIPIKEYHPWPAYFPPDKEQRVTRFKEIFARDLRRALVGLHSDHLIFMTHPKGRHGEMITAYWFMTSRDTAYERWKNLEIL